MSKLESELFFESYDEAIQYLKGHGYFHTHNYDVELENCTVPCETWIGSDGEGYTLSCPAGDGCYLNNE